MPTMRFLAGEGKTENERIRQDQQINERGPSKLLASYVLCCFITTARTYRRNTAREDIWQ